MAARTSRSVPSREMGLIPMPLVSGKRIFLTFISSRSQAIDLLRLGRARGPLHARVDVLGVLPEDDHVHVLRPLHRAGHALEVAHRPQADVEVQLLAQGDVQRADAAAHRRGQRALDAHQVLAEGGQRLGRHPLLRPVEGLLPGQDLQPGDLAAAAVGLLHRGVEDALRGAPDVAAGAVAFDVGDDRMVGDAQHAAGDRDLLASGEARFLWPWPESNPGITRQRRSGHSALSGPPRAMTRPRRRPPSAAPPRCRARTSGRCAAGPCGCASRRGPAPAAAGPGCRPGSP